MRNQPEMVTSKSMLDTILKLTNITTPIRARLHSHPMTLTITPLTSIGVPSVKLINPKTMPQTLPITPLIPAPPSPTLNPIPIIPPLHPIPFIPPTHKVVINPTPITLPSMKLPLIKIPITIKLHPLSPNPLFILILILIPILPPHCSITDEPLNRFVAPLGRKPEPLQVPIPSVLQNRNGSLDQTLVPVREVEHHGEEDQHHQHVLGSNRGSGSHEEVGKELCLVLEFLLLLLLLLSEDSSGRKSSSLTEERLWIDERVVGDEHRSSEDWVRVSLVWVWLFFGASIAVTHVAQCPPHDL
ncbi:hypothetical protein CR513_22280, partial [Mucuna pruriens]